MEFTVLVMSCDKNLKLLDIFFKYFKFYFSEYSGEIVLSLENIKYDYENLHIKTVCSGNSSIKWSDRLLDALPYVDTKAVLFLLDDFIIEKEVDFEELNRIAKMINEDDKIAHFALTEVPMKNASNDIFYQKYFKRSQFGRYKTTLQCGMWNKDELQDVLKKGENAWEVELFANIRSFLSKRNYYALANNKYKPIKYNDGLFCVQGMINKKERIRLENELKDNFKIDGIEENSGELVRDNIALPQRISRRSKIIVLNLIYRIKYYFKFK